jgi:hypothetical protein
MYPENPANNVLCIYAEVPRIPGMCGQLAFRPAGHIWRMTEVSTFPKVVRQLTRPKAALIAIETMVKLRLSGEKVT